MKKKIPEKSIVLGLRLPAPLCVRMQEVMHRRVVRQMLSVGLRSELSPSGFVREALEYYLAHCEALEAAGVFDSPSEGVGAGEPPRRRGRPPKVKPPVKAGDPEADKEKKS